MSSFHQIAIYIYRYNAFDLTSTIILILELLIICKFADLIWPVLVAGYNEDFDWLILEHRFRAYVSPMYISHLAIFIFFSPGSGVSNVYGELREGKLNLV